MQAPLPPPPCPLAPHPLPPCLQKDCACKLPPSPQHPTSFPPSLNQHGLGRLSLTAKVGMQPTRFPRPSPLALLPRKVCACMQRGAGGPAAAQVGMQAPPSPPPGPVLWAPPFRPPASKVCTCMHKGAGAQGGNSAAPSPRCYTPSPRPLPSPRPPGLHPLISM